MLGKARIKERLRRGEMLTNMVMRLNDPAIAEIIALSGVDIVTVDYTHYPFNEEKLCDIIRALELHGAACIVRLESVDETLIGKVMDCGADGIHIARLSTYEQAKALVDAVKYAPEGRRGLCPIVRASGYGLEMSYEEYCAYANEQTLLVAQIETKEGIENLDKILTLPQIDYFCGGKADLSASYGVPGQVDHPLVVHATEEMRRKVKAAGRYLLQKGGTPEEVAELSRQGVSVVGLGSDQQILMGELMKLVGAVKGK